MKRLLTLFAGIFFLLVLTAPVAVAGAGKICTPAACGNGYSTCASQAARINAAIQQCVAAGGGIVDLRQEGMGDIDQVVEVGDNTSAVTMEAPITVWMPQGNFTWTVTNNFTGNDCVFRLHNRASMINIGGSGNTNVGRIKLAADATVKNIICSVYPTGDAKPYATVRLEGFEVSNDLGGTVTDALVRLEGTKDNSLIESMNIHDPGPGVISLRIGGSGGSRTTAYLSVWHNWISGSDQGRPLVIEGVSGAGAGPIRLNSNTIGGPGAAYSIIEITSVGSVYTSDIISNNDYIEGCVTCSVMPTVPLVKIKNSNHITFRDLTARTFGSTGGGWPWAFDVSQDASGLTNSISFFETRANTPNYVNDHVGNTTKTGAANNTMEKYRICGTAYTPNCS